MKDFKIDLQTGELILDDGLEIEQDETTVAAQRLKLALDINLGEWFADIEFGLPYIKTDESQLSSAQRYFLGEKASDLVNFIKVTTDDFIEERDYITSVTSSYEFDRSTRKYTYSYEAVTSEGETISSSVSTTV